MAARRGWGGLGRSRGWDAWGMGGGGTAGPPGSFGCEPEARQVGNGV